MRNPISFVNVMFAAVLLQLAVSSSVYAQQKKSTVKDSVEADGVSADQKKPLDSLWQNKKLKAKQGVGSIATKTKQSIIKDSTILDSTSRKNSITNQKKALGNTWDQKKSNAKSQVKNTTNETKKTIANKPKEVATRGEQLLDGDGITTENAKEKIGGFINDTDVSGGDLKQKATGAFNDQNLSVDKVKETAGQVLDNPEGKIDNVLKGVDINDPLNSATKIFSDKELKFAYDSLLTKVDWNVVNALLNDPNAVSDGALLEAVFVKFPGLKNVSKVKQDATLLMGMQSGINPTQTLASLAAVHLHDLKNLNLKDSALSQLPPLHGSKLDSSYNKYAAKYWKVLDSLRKVNLKMDGLKLEEKQLTDLSKESVIKKKLGFLDKLYVEGIIGLLNGGWNGNLNLIQLSPALGYHITKNISLGVGPNIVLQTQNKRLNCVLGVRSFLKYELLKYNLYFQAEDNLLFPKVDKNSIEEKETQTEHAAMIGGGYLLPLTKKISLNLNVMYRVVGNNNTTGMSGNSPFVYRIGISSNRAKAKAK